MVSHMYTNLPVNAIVRLPHPRSGDSQGQETFFIYIYIRRTKETTNNTSLIERRRPLTTLVFYFATVIAVRFLGWTQGSSSYANDVVVFPSYEMSNRLKNV